MSRTIFRCHACRSSVLDAFTALGGVSIRTQQLPLRTIRPMQPPSRRLNTTAMRLQSISNESKSTDLKEEVSQPPPEDVSAAQSLDLDSSASSSSSDVPWYLRIPDPLPPAPAHNITSSLLARQQIPPLPDSPPALLSPLLEHLSTAIGLDSLTLLDLRNVHPPPALGANLLMIIGTARSVKHLNVSADRLCRWLRSEYGLRPYADGLLGRNELKLRLRRRNKRLMLRRAAGRDDAEAERDDGITTGWVCVNLGAVDGVVVKPTQETDEAASPQHPRYPESAAKGEPEYDNPDPDEVDVVFEHEVPSAQHEEGAAAADDAVSSTNPSSSFGTDVGADNVDPTYVGFGSREASQRIVVQMFTEDKRAEVNLEELWDLRNTRRVVKEEKAEARRRWQDEHQSAEHSEDESGAKKAAESDELANRNWEAEEQEDWAPLFKNIKKR